MDFMAHFESSWKLFVKFIAPLVVMTLVMLAVSFFSLGILAPVTSAGYMHAILLMIREGRKPEIGDLFSQMKLFFPLLGFGLAAAIAALIGFSLFFVPGVLIILAISFACLYMLPLMTDKNMGLIDAIKESYSMSINGDIADNMAVYIIFAALIAAGGSFFIGTLLTQPFAAIFLMSVYEEKTGPHIKQESA